MGKKKNNGNKPHPNKSFEQYVADATLAKFEGYIDQQVEVVGRAMAQYQMRQLAVLTLRIKAIEELLGGKLGVTAAELGDKVAEYEDQAEGFQEVKDGGLLVGDRARVEITHKKSEEADFSKPVRLMVNNAGSGQTLGEELEAALVGLTTGETREVIYGPEGVMTARLTINRLSRRPAPPVPAAQPEAVSA